MVLCAHGADPNRLVLIANLRYEDASVSLMRAECSRNAEECGLLYHCMICYTLLAPLLGLLLRVDALDLLHLDEHVLATVTARRGARRRTWRGAAVGLGAASRRGSSERSWRLQQAMSINM